MPDKQWSTHTLQTSEKAATEMHTWIFTISLVRRKDIYSACKTI